MGNTFFFFHNLIAIMNGLVLECFTLPNPMDTVLQWALVSVIFVTDNSFKNTATTVVSLLLESTLGLPGSCFDAFMQLKRHSCTTAYSCRQVIMFIKLGGFDVVIVPNLLRKTHNVRKNISKLL